MKKLILMAVFAAILGGCGPPEDQSLGPATKTYGIVQHKDKVSTRFGTQYELSIYLPKSDDLMKLAVDAEAYDESKVGDTVETMIIKQNKK